MSTPDPATASYPEPTPEALAMVRKARIAFGLTLGVMIVGLIVVGGTLVYRLTGGGAPSPGQASESGTAYSAAAVKIPAGAQVVSAIATGGTISVTYRNGMATSLRIFDGRTGAILREIPIVGE